MFRIEHDISTGEIKEILLSDQEINAAEKSKAEFIKIKNEKIAAIQAEVEAKTAARQAIADRLGLTADELAVLLG